MLFDLCVFTLTRNAAYVFSPIPRRRSTSLFLYIFCLSTLSSVDSLTHTTHHQRESDKEENMTRKRGQRESTPSQRRQITRPPHSSHTSEQREIWDQEDTFDDEFDEEEEGDDDEDRPSAKRRSIRKRRNDAGIPRMKPRDIKAFRWIGEQGAARRDDLQELLGRMPE